MRKCILMELFLAVFFLLFISCSKGNENGSTPLDQKISTNSDQEPNLEWQRIGPPGFRSRVMTLAIGPDKRSIIYLGVRPEGIYRSDDSGESWQLLTVDVPFNLNIGPNQHSLSISPHDPKQLFLGIEKHGIFKSMDRGNTWNLANKGLLEEKSDALNGICFAFHPKNESIIFYGSDAGIYRSMDSGCSWEHLTKGLPSTTIAKIAIHPTQPNKIYAAIAFAPPETPAGVYISEDLGDTWGASCNGLPEGNDELGAQFSGAYSLVISERDPNIIFVGTRRGIYISKDGGAKWKSYERNFDQAVTDVLIHPEDSSIVFVGLEDGSVYNSKDFGKSWSDKSRGLTVGLKRDPVTIEFRRPDGQKVKTTFYREQSRINQLEFDPNDPNILFAATLHGLFRLKMNSCF